MADEITTVISRCPHVFRMAIANDRRAVDILGSHWEELPAGGKVWHASGVTEVPTDLLEAWTKANWDADVIDLLQWPGKTATRRAGVHERGGQ
jgi:hypothetical protein